MNDSDVKQPEPVERREAANRRKFIGVSAGVVASAVAAPHVHASNDETLRLALVGCGARGSGAIRQAMATQGPTRLVAMADLFQDRLQRSLKLLKAIPEVTSQIDVPGERQFVGFDSYVHAINSADVVVLATPPHFRPIHYAAAVEAGKHVFMEKPCCVDAPGYRQLVAANKVAREKGLSVGVGLQRRHLASYQQQIDRIRNGEIGDLIYLRSYFNVSGDGPDYRRCPDDMTEMQWQCRRWIEYTWLSGDFLVEQTCHSIDVANWVMDGHPVTAHGVGGRHVRIGPANGDQFDHHHIEFVYEGGTRYACQGRQIAGTRNDVSETAHGTKGELEVGSGLLGTPTRRRRRGEERVVVNPYQQEHDDLLASIRGGKPLFAGDYGAVSSMTAVMGRMASYSGKEVTWEQATTSELSLSPDRYSFDATPPTMPGPTGEYPVAIPGKTQAW